MKKHSATMLQGPVLWGVITYTIPIILTSILQLLFNAADLVIVGRFCGSISVAAVGATCSSACLWVPVLPWPMPSAAGRNLPFTGRSTRRCRLP